MNKYDYLIVGSGLFGAVFARQMHDAGKRVLVIDRRSHAGGNIYCEEKEGIQIHRYGAHIFIRQMKRYGIIYAGLMILTGILIVRWRIIRGSCIISPLI